MNDTSSCLAERRELLVARAAAQRGALGRHLGPWRVPFALADQGLASLRFIRRHPAWVVGGVVLFVALRPGRVGTWLRRSWVAWRIIRSLRAR